MGAKLCLKLKFMQSREWSQLKKMFANFQFRKLFSPKKVGQMWVFLSQNTANYEGK
jgi:hypothetical protein